MTDNDEDADMSLGQVLKIWSKKIPDFFFQIFEIFILNFKSYFAQFTRKLRK